MESLLNHRLNEYLPLLAKYHSTSRIKKSLLYQSLETEIDRVMNGSEYGFYAPALPLEKKPFYRMVTWNIERGIEFEGVLDFFKNHELISTADVWMLPETDLGMIRSQNKNVAREIAQELKLNYFFAPSYLNLCIGNSAESHYQGQNTLGLHGNALMSRYPITNLRVISLKNCKDKMKGNEKRLGCQKVLVADVQFPFKPVTVVCAHLDAHSSQRQRAMQMDTILGGLSNNPLPVLVGGDLNTSTYNARHGFFAFCGFWNKVFRGVDNVIKNHYPYPDRFFEKRLFDVVRKYGYDVEPFNEIGKGTLHYHIEDLKGNHMVRDIVPEWCRKIMENTLKRHGGKVSLKLDWFLAKGLKVASPASGALPPTVIGGLKYQGRPTSDHDAILVDVDLY